MTTIDKFILFYWLLFDKSRTILFFNLLHKGMSSKIAFKITKKTSL